MDPLLFLFLCCMALGTVVGILAGLLGIGGGLLIVPALVFLLSELLSIEVEHGMPIAVATSLSTIIFTGLSSALTHYKLGNLDFRIVLYVGLGISLGAIAGAIFAVTVSGVILQRVFAILVALIAIQMVFLKRPTSDSEQVVGAPKLIVVGSGSGFLSSLMGIGGGALLVPALVWFHVNIKRAIGCASFCGVLIAIVATITFILSGLDKPYLPDYSLGYVYAPATFGIVLTSMLTAPVGARLTNKLDTNVLKRVFALFLIIVSIRMLIGLE